MNCVSLPIWNPTPLDNTRDRLADDFAQRIFEAAPEIGKCIELAAKLHEGACDRHATARAMQLLAGRCRELQSHAAAAVRRIFDYRLSLMVNGGERAAHAALDNLTLLSDERLDEEIAVSRYSRRLKEQCDFAYWSLTRRIATLAGTGHPTDRNNPVFPHTFAQAMLDAIGLLENEPDVRLLLFKSFGPSLLDIVPAVYAAANTALAACGMDVDAGEYAAHTAGNAMHVPGTLRPGGEVRPDDSRENDQLVSTLTHLLARSGSTQATYVDVGSESLPCNLPPATTATRADPLVTLPTAPPVRAIAPPAESADPAWYFDLRSFGEQPVAEPSAPGARSAPSRTLHGTRQTLQGKLTVEEQVVNDVVTVMFDRLLVEPRLPPALREVMAQLQLPVLEMALGDDRLLTQVEHPVRRLIDLIAAFGLTLGRGADDDDIVRAITNSIDGLVKIHHTQADPFSLVFEELDELFHYREESALRDDGDLRSLERREAIEFAAAQADREITLRLQHIRLPAAIKHFILNTWRDVLIHDYLHGGPRGEPWRLGLATLDDIVRSLQPATDDSERRRLARYLPSFIELLMNVPDAGEDQDLVASNFFVELDRAQQLAAEGRWDEIGGETLATEPATFAQSRAAPPPVAAHSAAGPACGDWVEIHDPGAAGDAGRWRLNWITSIQGTCILRQYETNQVRHMRRAEWTDRLERGEIRQARGLGIADRIVSEALETVSRKTRREQASQAGHAAAAPIVRLGIPALSAPLGFNLASL